MKYLVRLSNQGRLVLPLELRSVLGLEDGEALSLMLEANGVVSLQSVRLRLVGLKGKYAKKPDSSLKGVA